MKSQASVTLTNLNLKVGVPEGGKVNMEKWERGVRIAGGGGGGGGE